MSDKFSKEDIEKFFVDKGVTSNCESCGHNSWHVFDDLAQVRPVQGISRVLAERYFPVVLMGCTHCGHLRQYAYTVMEEWLKEQKNQTS